MGAPATGWIVLIVIGIAAASLAVGYGAAAIISKARRGRAATEAGTLLAEAERDAAVLEGLERLSTAPNRKIWADRVSSTITTLTGTSGAAVILRAPGGDAMSLAGSSVPLVIRNLEATVREPHGPSRRALASGEPVAMSAGELPAWGAAAGFEAGAVFPILFHGASIGLAYALGKPWQVPSAEAVAAALRFVTLAASHYSVAAPFTAPGASATGIRNPVPAPGGKPETIDRPPLRPVSEPSIEPPQAPASRLIPASAIPARPTPAVRTLAAPEQAPAVATAAATPTAVHEATEGAISERRRIDLPGVVVDPRTERCVIDGRAVALSKTEFDLLYALASNRGEVVTSEQLIRSVWGGSTTAPSSALDVTIHRVRRKLGRAPGGAELVRTVRGKGYAISIADGESI